MDYFGGEFGYLRDTPANLRRDPQNVKKIDLMVGFAKDEGAWILANNCTCQIAAAALCHESLQVHDMIVEL